MKTKKEIIRNAWGDKYNDRVDNNGWCDFNKNHSYNSDLFDTGYFPDCITIRPKTLAGIENNNRWTSILSEDDLPKDNGLYWTLRKGSVVALFVEIFYDLDKEYWLSNYTHYQHAIKPKLPLY